MIDDGVTVVGRGNFNADDEEEEEGEEGTDDNGGRNIGYGARFISKGKPNGDGIGGLNSPRSLGVSRRGIGGGRRADVDRSLLAALSFSR